MTTCPTCNQPVPDPDAELIEKMAKAIYDTDYHADDWGSDSVVADGYRRYARAALAVVREHDAEIEAEAPPAWPPVDVPEIKYLTLDELDERLHDAYTGDYYWNFTTDRWASVARTDHAAADRWDALVEQEQDTDEVPDPPRAPYPYSGSHIAFGQQIAWREGWTAGWLAHRDATPAFERLTVDEAAERMRETYCVSFGFSPKPWESIAKPTADRWRDVARAMSGVIVVEDDQ